MIFRILILSFFFLFNLTSSQDYLSVCAIFQNEAPYLKEWIEYHRLLGVEHFYLYNNSSSDDYKKVLKPYIRKNIVTLTNWPSPSDKNWTPYQKRAYNHCLLKFRKMTKWLAFIDIDEFIVPVTYNTLPAMLKKYEKAGGLQIFWQFFGTSHYYEIPENQLLIESLLLKAPKDSGLNYNFKTIVQTAVTEEVLVHGSTYRHPWYAIFPHGTRGGALQPIHIDIVRINHYWTRDEKYFREKKIARRARYEGVTYTEERIQALLNGLNQETDGAILRFVPALKQRLANEQ